MDYFYRKWYNSREQHSLHPFYRPLPPSVHDLPPFFDLDPPSVCSHRSRLRLNRARLNVSMFERKLCPSPLCSCGGANESVLHVIEDCPLYDSIRRICIIELSMYNISFNMVNVLNSPDIPGLLSASRVSVHDTTCKFIRTIYTIRKF